MKKSLLKKDLFGEVWLVVSGQERAAVLRDASAARRWLAWPARHLLQREANALAALSGIEGFPAVLESDHDTLTREYLTGEPLYKASRPGAAFFAAASRLLRRMHRAGVVHNDLAKEPNILVLDDGSPAFIDFQLSWYSPRRGRCFRAAAREDIRHLLKHKRTYYSQGLTRRELDILATPSLPARIWMRVFKPVYLLITRRIFGWADREGAADRGRQE